MMLLSERKKMADEGKIQMCIAEYNGTWLPYKQRFNEVTVDWLLKEMTYDDCSRKEEIAKYLSIKFNEMERKNFELNELKNNLNKILIQIEK